MARDGESRREPNRTRQNISRGVLIHHNFDELSLMIEVFLPVILI
jgi:hypothetical protein